MYDLLSMRAMTSLLMKDCLLILLLIGLHRLYSRQTIHTSYDIKDLSLSPQTMLMLPMLLLLSTSKLAC